MTKIDLAKAKPIQIISGIREPYLRVIQVLLYQAIVVEKIWTQYQVAKLVGREQSTISRWLKDFEGGDK